MVSLLSIQSRLLRRRALAAAACPEVSRLGYLCSVSVPHEVHETWLDGRLLDRWDA